MPKFVDVMIAVDMVVVIVVTDPWKKRGPKKKPAERRWVRKDPQSQDDRSTEVIVEDKHVAADSRFIGLLSCCICQLVLARKRSYCMWTFRTSWLFPLFLIAS